MLIFYFSTNGCLNVPVSRTAVSGILLRNRWIVQHGHSFNTQQHSQAPCNHVVEYNGAVRGEEKKQSHETKLTLHVVVLYLEDIFPPFIYCTKCN